jgi:DNA-binding protein YbaB
MDMRSLLQMGQQMQAKMNEVQEFPRGPGGLGGVGGGMVTPPSTGRVTSRGSPSTRRWWMRPTWKCSRTWSWPRVREAQKKAREVQEAEMKKVAGGLTGGLPLPFKLPGF